MQEYIIGIDLGGTKIKAAAVTKKGKIIFQLSRDTQVSLGKFVVVNNLINVIVKIRKKLEKSQLLSIGIGVPGVVSPKKGIVYQSPNFPDWINFNLVTHLKKGLIKNNIKAPLFIENDANVFALGETWVGAAKGVTNFCCITLGTGVGGGIILNNELWNGEDGMAGEIGHINIEPEGFPCGCGGKGCWERYVAADGIKRTAKQGFNTSIAGTLRQATNNQTEKITPEVIYQLAKINDPYCINIYQKMGRYLGIGLADLVNVLNIHLFVIGGGISRAWDYFIPSAKEEMLKRTYKIPGKNTKFKRARGGNKGGMIGAAYLALRKSIPPV